MLVTLNIAPKYVTVSGITKSNELCGGQIRPLTEASDPENVYVIPFIVAEIIYKIYKYYLF